MAAVGLASGTVATTTVFGDQAIHVAQLAAVSDTNTYDTGLSKIIDGGVQITFASDAAVAADSIAVASISGGVITFQVAGTARISNLLAIGRK